MPLYIKKFFKELPLHIFQTTEYTAKIEVKTFRSTETTFCTIHEPTQHSLLSLLMTYYCTIALGTLDKYLDGM